MFRFWAQTESTTHNRCCEADGCCEPGLYPAPKKPHSSTEKNKDVFWFCLTHVRFYNRQWNFFRGMNEDQLSQQWRRDMSWERPSWPLGDWFAKRRFFRTVGEDVNDPFGVFGSNQNQSQGPAHPPSKQDTILALFELDYPFTEEQLQKAYRRLVKQYHPDVNHHNPKADEKMREINAGYSLLKKRVA